MKVLGPYRRKTDGRAFILIYRSDGTKTTQLLSRFLYEAIHGPIPHGMTVDHIDGDKTNDVIENLQLLSQQENSRKWHTLRPAEVMSLLCPLCGNAFTRRANVVRHNKKQGKAGPFCSKSCAGKYRTSSVHVFQAGRETAVK